MPRLINPVPQYLDKDGKPLFGAKMTFLIAGSNTPAETFEDVFQNKKNDNPLPLDKEARLPDVFFSGGLRAILRDKNGQIIFDRDFIGSGTGVVPLIDWISEVTYPNGFFVLGSDGEIYQSLTDNNTGNDPTSSPADWQQVRFIGLWNPNVDYAIGDIVQTDNGDLYKSLVTPNLGNDPIGDTVNWFDAIIAGYDNTTSGLTATTEQDAIDEIMTIRQEKLDNPLLWLPFTRDFKGIGTGDIEFTRASTATYVDRYGIVQTAAFDRPRFEENGLLIEGESTNLILRSEEFDAGSWTKVNATILGNTETAPNGSVTADKIQHSNATSYDFVLQSPSPLPALNDIHTYSVFAKKSDWDFLFIRVVTGLGGQSGKFFDLNTGTLGSDSPGGGATILSSSILALSNGWYRCNLTVQQDSDADPSRGQIRLSSTDTDGLISPTGTGTEGIFIWGAQVEELPFASSYMPTVGAVFTRNEEITTLNVLNNFLTIVQGDHSQFFFYDTLGDSGTLQTIYDGQPTAFRNSVFIRQTTGLVEYRDTSADNAQTSSLGFDQRNAIACITSGQNITIFENGVAGGTSAVTTTDPIDLDGLLFIGSRNVGAFNFFGHLKDFRVYDFALNPAEIIRLAG